MKTYISGKITGLPKSEYEKRFTNAEMFLKKLKLNPINPLKNGLSENASWSEHMVRDIEILSTCKAIFMLDNWKESRGARIEYEFAVGAGKCVLFEELMMTSEAIQLFKEGNNTLEMIGFELRVHSLIHLITDLNAKLFTGKI